MTRLYRIFNEERGEYGKPVGMCDDHYANWKARDRFTVEKVSDTTDEPCNHCERDRMENERSAEIQ